MKAVRMRNGGMARGARLRVGLGEVVYPESDGKPMAETDEHLEQMMYLVAALKLWFKKRRLVYVAGNNLIYYQQGDPKLRVSPDTYVVKGVENRRRRVFRLWEEKKAPCVAIEVSSKGTRREDLVTKFRLYRDVLRVKEYYIFDPLREYLPGRMKAWELVRGDYVERQIEGDRILSRELGLFLVDAEMLRLVDPRTGVALRTHDEAEARRRGEAEGRRREAEGRRREAEGRMRAEAERDALRAEVERLRRVRRS